MSDTTNELILEGIEFIMVYLQNQCRKVKNPHDFDTQVIVWFETGKLSRIWKDTIKEPLRPDLIQRWKND